MRLHLHRSLDGFTVRGRAPIGPPSLSVFRMSMSLLVHESLRPQLRCFVASDGGGRSWWLRLPFARLALRLHLSPRHVLWGARTGDYQLARRSALELASQHGQGLPAGASCIGASAVTDRYWFWIPVL